MKTTARLPLTQLPADETHVEGFKALAHRGRLEVFFVLVKAGKEMSVGGIQEAVETPGPTLSHHPDVLRRAGLLESRREERYVYYSVQRERVTALVRLLTACCQGKLVSATVPLHRHGVTRGTKHRGDRP